jgi:hypothetical protein
MKRSSLRYSIPALLVLQLAMLWLQGAQIHRQNLVLQGLREDIQGLAETIENSQGPASYEDESQAVPASFLTQAPPPKKTAVLGAEEEQEAVTKELQATRESGQKAVKDSREAQSKLSITENIRKAEEAKKIQEATGSWHRWGWVALLLGAGAFAARGIIRRRG